MCIRDSSIAVVLAETSGYSQLLRSGNLSLSRADLFVIAASQALITSGRDNLDFARMTERLQSVYQAIMAEPAVDTLAAE